MIRMILFFITNFAVIMIFGLTLYLTGIQVNDIQKLLNIALLFGFGGSFISLLLSKWIALKSVNGEIIQKPYNDTQRWLIDTVNQQACQTGIAVPKIAIYSASDINAFAAGACRNHSLVAVSTGLLQCMTRSEAEAVIAHEISHIANGDMVTMSLIQGVVNTFVIFISRMIAHIITHFIDNNRNDKEQNHYNSLTYFIVTTILELVFGILASIITMWFSRRREFYADAGSAKIVGYEKMIAALQRLKTSCEPQESSNIIMFCIHGKYKSLSTLFMTHPLLDERIEALRNRKY